MAPGAGVLETQTGYGGDGIKLPPVRHVGGADDPGYYSHDERDEFRDNAASMAAEATGQHPESGVHIAEMLTRLRQRSLLAIPIGSKMISTAPFDVRSMNFKYSMY